MTNPMNTEQAIAVAVTTLSETLPPRQPLTKAGAQGYLIALKVLTADEVGTALGRALSECKFMPSPAELLAFAGKGGAKDLTFRMAQAWEAVVWAMNRYDYTDSVDFGSLVNAIVRNMGGWVQLCNKTVPQLVWERKKFEELYAAYVEKSDYGDSGRPLLGSMGYGAVPVPIGGVLPPKQIAAPITDVSKLIRDLGDGAELK